MSTFQIYRPLHPPTGVEHAVHAHFTSVSRWNVVLARTSLLEVFDVRQGPGGQRVLDLVASFPLFGNIETMHVVRLGGLDALLLSFREAKLSLVAFDPGSHRLRTLFIHDFEPGSPGGGAKAKAGICEQLNGLADVQLVRVDSDSQCAVMTLCDTHLAVTPFKHGVNTAGGGGGAAATTAKSDAAAAAAAATTAAAVATTTDSTTTIPSSSSSSAVVGAGGAAGAGGADGMAPSGVAHAPFVLSLKEMGIEGFVKDMVFLGGFFEPTLLVLHELERTSSGRLSRRACTCAVTAISLALSRQAHTRIWFQAGLPSDAAVLLAVPAALGGAVVLSTNALLYVNKTSRCVLAVNEYARATVDVHRLGTLQPQNIGNSGKDDGAEPITLDAARCAFLADDRLLISTRTGHLYLASLLCKGGAHSVSSLALSRLGSSVLCTCICAIPELRLFLLGSRLADSQLITYEDKPCATPRSQEVGGDDAQLKRTLDEDERGSAEPDPKRGKVAAAASSDDDDLYGGSDDAAAPVAAAPATAATATAVVAVDEDDDDDLYGADAPAIVSAGLKGSSLSGGGAVGRRGEGRVAWVPASFHDSPYTLRPCYSLYNIGPIGDITVGESPAANDDDEDEDEGGAKVADSDTPRRLELVSCSGYGKNCSLATIRRGLRHELTVEVELPDLEAADCHLRAKGMWALRSGGGNGGEHAFLILSGKTASSLAPSAAPSSSSSSSSTTAEEKEGARKETTRVLYTREGLAEVGDEYEDHGFYTAGPTLVAGNVGGATRNFIVQVFPDGARVLDGPTARQEIPRDADLDVGGMGVPVDVRILAACVVDPFVLLRLSDGTLRLLEAEEESGDVVASVPDMPRAGGPVMAACLFRDDARMLAKLLVAREPASSAAAGAAAPGAESSLWGAVVATPITLDDDDDLYADGPKAEVKEEEKEAEEGATSATDAPTRTFCTVCRESGTLEIYTVPDFVKVFSAPRLPAGPAVLRSTLRQAGGGSGGGDGGAGEDADASNEGRMPEVNEMAMHCLGATESALCRCVLAVCCGSGDLYVYTLRNIDASFGILPFFSREQTGVVTHHRQSKVALEQAQAVATALATHRKHFRYPRLTCFDNVGSRSGMFFNGSHQPLWLLCDGGRVQASPLGLGFEQDRVAKDVKRPVVCFTPLNGEALCEDGFAYFHQSGVMRICKLSDASSKSANTLGGGPMVVRKAKLGCTAHKILYLGREGTGGVLEALQVPTYVIVVSVPNQVPDKPEPAPVDDGGMQDPNVAFDSKPQLFEPDEAFTPELPYGRHELRLVQSGGWDTTYTFQLRDNEEVGALQLVFLRDAPLPHANSGGGGGGYGRSGYGGVGGQNQQQRYGQQWNGYHQQQQEQRGSPGHGAGSGRGEGGVRKPYLVVGTCTLNFDGEDSQGRGRLMLFALDFGQYTEADGGLTSKKPKLRLVHEQETKAHVSCASQLLDFVVVSEGRQLFVYEWAPEPGGGVGDLRACGFYDMDFYPVSLSVVKNMLLVGDVYRSVQLLRWREDKKNLDLVALDDNDLPVFASEFVADEKTLAFLVADEFKNTFMFKYSGAKIEGGKKLLCCGDFHLGAHVTKLLRQRSVIVEPLNSDPKREHSYVTVLGTLDGGLGVMLPVDEKSFRRLYSLQQIMLNALEHEAALNPKGFRCVSVALASC